MLHKRRAAAAALSTMLVLAFAPLASAEPTGTWLSQLHEATEQVFEGWRGWWLPETSAVAAVRPEEAGVGTRKEGCGMDPNGGAGCHKRRGRAAKPDLGAELDRQK